MISDLLIKSLSTQMFTKSDTEALMEITRLEATGQKELLEIRVRNFKSRFALSEKDWMDTKTVSIDFYKSENLTISEDSKDDLCLKIKSLGTFKIPKEKFFNGVDELKKLLKDSKNSSSLDNVDVVDIEIK